MSININNIGKMPIKKLIKDMIIRSSLLAVIDFRDLILVNPNFTYTEVMEQLVRQALSQFERRCPLFKRSKVYLNEPQYTFTDNFSAFLEGNVSEEYTTLIPRSAPYNLDASLLHSRRSWTYTRPMVSGIYPLGLCWIEYIASYPVVFKADTANDVDDFTDDSCIYYLSLEGGMTQDFMFRQQFYYTVLEYVNNVKNNLQYPDMPIMLLQGIELEMQTLQNELSEFYRRSASHGRLLR